MYLLHFMNKKRESLNSFELQVYKVQTKVGRRLAIVSFLTIC